jgi:hypothetical protein
MIDLFTIIIAPVDDRYWSEGIKLSAVKSGAKAVFTDSEVITLMLIMPSHYETQYIGFIWANYLALFPKLVDQSQFNRRARALRLLVEHLRRYWLV